MNIHTEGTSLLETIDTRGPATETSSTPSPSLLQELISPNPVNSLVKITPCSSRASPSELQAFVTPIIVSLNTPEKISSDVGSTGTPQLEPGCFPSFSAFELDATTNAQKSDTLRLQTEVNIEQNASISLDPKPGYSTSHCSPFMLRPIPNPAKPITTRKRTLRKSEISTSTPIKEDQKQKFVKNKVKNVTKRLDDI
nr:uncharacterized protein LOC111508002 [Leptinotarsa decemlineata]